MFIAKGLLVKGLAGLTAFVGVGGTAIAYRKEIKDYFWASGNSPNADINNKITTLGLPEDCKFEENGSDTSKNCNISGDQLKAVKFKNIEGESITVTGLDSETITLEIKKFNTPTEEEKNRYKTDLSSDDLWFTFKNLTKDITIKKGANDDTNQIKLIKGTNPEFKINSENKLEKAWTVTTLGEKVGLTCNTSQPTETCCPLGETTTIDFLDGETVKKMTVSDDSKSKTITVTKDQQDYNQGFKFNVSSEISGSDASVKLATGDYEIKYEESKGWHLAKKST